MAVMIGLTKLIEKNPKTIRVKKFSVIDNCGHFSFLENQKSSRNNF